MSPMELVDALLLAVARDITNKLAEEQLKVWNVCLRNVPFTFKRLSSEDAKYFEAFNMREALIHQAHHLQHTATQNIAALMAFRTRKEASIGAVNYKQLINLYAQNAKYALTSEVVSETWVKAACTVWDRLLTHSDVYGLVMKLEESYGVSNPLNNTYTLESFAVKTGSNRENVMWVLGGILDILQASLFGTW